MLSGSHPVESRSVVAFLLICIFLNGFIGLSSANNSEYSYLNSENSPLDIQTQSHEISLVNLKVNFSDGEHSIVFNSNIMPYGLSLGKFMSYHE